MLLEFSAVTDEKDPIFDLPSVFFCELSRVFTIQLSALSAMTSLRAFFFAHLTQMCKILCYSVYNY